MFAFNPEDLNLIPRAHVAEGEDRFINYPLTSTRAVVHGCPHKHTDKQVGRGFMTLPFQDLPFLVLYPSTLIFDQYPSLMCGRNGFPMARG